jgi:NhaP-type Na+/H+ and K+/H+ antiporter
MAARALINRLTRMSGIYLLLAAAGGLVIFSVTAQIGGAQLMVREIEDGRVRRIGLRLR